MTFSREKDWLLKEKYGGKATPEFDVDVKRLESGEPLAYVIGWVDFLGCRIELTSRPLIPRPETEWWVERIIERMVSEKFERANVLDLFSGSGCIGISLLKHFPEITVDLGEIDPKHCEQIGANIVLNGIEHTRASVIATNGFSDIHGTYDIVVANPPYIASRDIGSVDRSVLDHEPHIALFAGNDGMEFIEQLLQNAPQHLRVGGFIACEFGMGQERSVVTLARRLGWEPHIQNDQFETPRYGIFRRPGE